MAITIGENKKGRPEVYRKSKSKVGSGVKIKKGKKMSSKKRGG